MYFLKDLNENFLDLANPPVSVSVCLSCSGWKNCFIEWDFQVEHVFLPEKFLKTHSFICHDDLIYYKIFFFGEERRVEEMAVKYFIRSLSFTAWGGAGGVIREFWLSHRVLQYSDDPLSFEVNFLKSPPFIPLLCNDDPHCSPPENHGIPPTSSDISLQGNK